MRRAVIAFSFAILSAAGCRQDMHDNPRYEPLEGSQFFADGRSARPQVVGTVARGQYHTDTAFWEGVSADGLLLDEGPVEVTAELLARGQERFNIFCSPCHGRVGDAQGMIVQRGLKAPPSYHINRLREAPDGRLFEVISNGFGRMESFRDRIPAGDRWAIVAYIRALQLSQWASLDGLPADVKSDFESGLTAADHGDGHADGGDHDEDHADGDGQEEEAGH